jgi:AraC-like DNA-binding protein
MTKLVSPSPDAVSELLRSFAVRSSIFCVSELRAPWAFRVAGEQVAKFHLVVEGSALLVAGADEVALAEGDLAVLPRGSEHTLADVRAVDAPALEQLLAEHAYGDGTRLRYRGDGASTRLVCGGFALAGGISELTLARFPQVIKVPRDRALGPLLTLVRAETERNWPGAEAVVAKLADVFLTHALRGWLLASENNGHRDARLVGDDSVAKALDLLNHRPFEPWSLERLAGDVSLSRSALATKFRKRIGVSPMRYLSEVRLLAAARELEAGRLTLRKIARDAGYASEAAFAKAFKRRFGSSPGRYRACANEPPQIKVEALR